MADQPRRKFERTTLKPGQLLRYTTHSTFEDRTYLLYVEGFYRYQAATLPSCLVFRWTESRDPTPEEFAKLRPLMRDLTTINNTYSDVDDQCSHSPIAPHGSDLPSYPADRIRILPGEWKYAAGGNPDGMGVPFWGELDGYLAGYVEWSPPGDEA